ncbi:MAG: hypothetical protein RR472_07225, partial [Anaerovoracaceae bacterium]
MKKSRNKTKMIIAVLLIFASLVILIWYSFSTNQYRIALGEKESYLLSRQEEAWIKEHPEVKITIDKGLSLSPNQEVFFSLYLNKLMGRSGLEVRLDSTGEAEGRLVAITNENRAAMTEGLITKPLLKIEGHAFVKQQRQEKEVYEGVAIEGTFTEQEEKKLRFNGNKIHLTEVADMQG